MPKPSKDKKVDIPDSIIKLLLTDSELRMVKGRWQIIVLLTQGKTIRQVAAEAKVGTDTVMRIARMMEKDELSGIVKKMKSNQSASQISGSSSSWVFGKGEND